MFWHQFAAVIVLSFATVKSTSTTSTTVSTTSATVSTTSRTVSPPNKTVVALATTAATQPPQQPSLNKLFPIDNATENHFREMLGMPTGTPEPVMSVSQNATPLELGVTTASPTVERGVAGESASSTKLTVSTATSANLSTVSVTGSPSLKIDPSGVKATMATLEAGLHSSDGFATTMAPTDPLAPHAPSPAKKDKKMQRMLVSSEGLMGAMLMRADPAMLQSAATTNPVVRQMLAAQSAKNAQIVTMQNARFAAMQNAQLAAMQNQAIAKEATANAAARKQQSGAR